MSEKRYKYLILGAGPAGLSFANRLLERGETDFLVLEKEAQAGGLCRSMDVDGSPLDIGGGHFLDVRRPKVNEFLFQFMPEEEWDKYDRDSRIQIGEEVVSHPIEANIWQMSLEKQVEYLKAIATAGCNTGKEMPQDFVNWIYWKLGDRVAEDYMLPYNKKMFGEELNHLGTYWLAKLPNVSFEETLLSCLTKKPYGTQPGHAQFYYPKKFGYGELWKRMAGKLGDKICYNVPVKSIDFETKTVNGSFCAKKIVSTVPWTEFQTVSGMPETIKENLKALKYSSVVIEYVPERLDTEAQWIYCPDEELSYHRILVRHNFCPDSKGYWTETNSDRFTEQKSTFSYKNEYAYPLNTVEKPEAIKRLLEWSKEKGVYGLGRWGEWEHYNSDVVVELAMQLADSFTCISDET